MKLCQNGTVFLMIKPGTLAAGRNSEPQNIEYGISNSEGWKRFAKYFLKQTEYIHSTFDAYGPPLEDSTFISFFFDLIGRFFGPAAGLNTDIF